MRYLFTVLIIFLNLLLVAPVFADGENQPPGGENPPGITLPNPLGVDTIVELINKIISALRDYIAPPIVAIMVLYGAFQILFAGGEPEKFTTGRRTILYAAIGYAIILIASGIVLIIKDILDI